MMSSYEGRVKSLEKFRWFTTVYEYWKKLTVDTSEQEKIEKYFQKTLEIIHQETEIQKINQSLPAVKLGIDYLDKIRKSSLTAEEKAVNILFTLEKLVIVDQRKNPVYKTILDHLEELIKKWQERKIEYQELFQEENKIIDFIQEKEDERKELNLEPFEFGMLSLLNQRLPEKNQTKLREFINEIINTIREDLIENWRENSTLKQNIERKLRVFTLELKKEYKLTYDEFDKLHKDLVFYINDYAQG